MINSEAYETLISVKILGWRPQERGATFFFFGRRLPYRRFLLFFFSFLYFFFGRMLHDSRLQTVFPKNFRVYIYGNYYWKLFLTHPVEGYDLSPLRVPLECISIIEIRVIRKSRRGLDFVQKPTQPGHPNHPLFEASKVLTFF